MHGPPGLPSEATAQSQSGQPTLVWPPATPSLKPGPSPRSQGQDSVFRVSVTRTRHWSPGASASPAIGDDNSTHPHSCSGKCGPHKSGAENSTQCPGSAPSCSLGLALAPHSMLRPRVPWLLQRFLPTLISMSPGLGQQAGSTRGRDRGSHCAGSCPKIRYLPTSKDPAWPVTTVEGVRPAPLPGETLPSPSMDPAPLATTAHKELCTLCPVPRGR